MKIVIDIPQIMYGEIKQYGITFLSCDDKKTLRKLIANGVPLPKGHGRLIDEKEANGLIADGKNGKAYFGTVNKDWEVIDFLKTVSTIIEADKEGENEADS